MQWFPVIDISALTMEAGHRPTVEAIAQACTRHGFFVVSGHGVPETVTAWLERVTRAFFHLDVPVKSRFAGDTAVGRLGYRGLGQTNTAASLGRRTPADLVETFGVMNVSESTRYATHNLWPSEPADFRAAWTQYWMAMESVQNRLLRAFEAALGLPPGWFADKFDDAGSSLKANFYPAQTAAPLPSQQRRGAHTDFGFMTLLYQDDAPGGLQVEVATGQWADVPHVPGTLVVNVADLLSRWTNGVWKSSMHRVANPAPGQRQQERISVPFFVNPNDDAIIDTIPGCGDAGAQPPVKAGEWVAAKFASSTT
ncbi:isopenicillin N synthase family dioxygenase [Mycobacterium sp. MS1601]|uniref:isopenicillin N synthase family dioxygenase n=1 Tax=Mycobacterium sp. MS1601 TaxID=1936029 RepID=UPI0009F93715|nr:2OG-Fe(II) oxygenase family protein [Mycobacterium sp. MS1601]